MSFRKDFVWGAATAAYQIEGAAYEDGRGESVWDVHCHDTRKNPEGKQNILDGETGDVSCDFYHHYKEDIQRMKNMGLKAFRFSISWSRVLPDGTGRVNEKGLQFYSDLVDYFIPLGFSPAITDSRGMAESREPRVVCRIYEGNRGQTLRQSVPLDDIK